MDSTTILIDETGHTSLNFSKEGTSSHFIYTATSFRTSDIDKFEEARQRICLENNLSDNLRGNNIKERHFSKRLRILDTLKTLDFTIDVLVVDKKRLDSPGFKYRHSFYKFFQSTFVQDRFSATDECRITAEKVGSIEFKQDLENFIRAKAFELNLFTPLREFRLAGKEQKLLQIVDFLANCIGKIFCTSELHDRAPELWEKISARTNVEFFPYAVQPLIKNSNCPEFDAEIWKIGNETIQKYLENTSKESERKRVLRQLQIWSQLQPGRFIPTYEIIDYLKIYHPEVNEERLRRIIRDLRYDGLTIVSQSGKGGYKIATSYSDIVDNINHFMRYVEPMLQKLKVLNTTLSQQSHSRVNPIEKDPSFELVKKLLALI